MKLSSGTLRIALGLLVLGVVLGVSTPPTLAAIDISLWTMRTVEAQMANLREDVAEFEKQNPGIKVTIEAVPYSVVYPKLAAAIQAGNPPNVFNNIEAMVAFLHAKGVLEPLDDVINAVGRAQFTKKYLDWVSAGGKTWGIPDWALHQAVYYRKDLFAQKKLATPKSWSELLEVAKALNSPKDGIHGMGVPLGREYVGQQTYGAILYSAGAYVYDPATGKYVFDKNKEKAVRALKFLVDLYKAASPPASVDWSWAEYRTAFVKEKVAMTLEWGAVVGQAASENPGLLDKMSIFPFPGPDASDYPPKGNFGGAYFFTVSKADAAKVEASKKLLRFLWTPERLAKRANTRPVFAIPPVKAAFESATYQNNPMVKRFSQELRMLFQDVMPYEQRHGLEAGLSPLAGQIE
ncbi:MAG: sugar ABC transporter substrate-binding protein, partial [candidate division NC10 bacterium]|nr:sugar ABC transporter substrate-binding protein [candidate division NC10 bacterium]